MTSRIDEQEQATRFEITAVLFREDRTICPVSSALREIESWYDEYLRLWTDSDGFAGLGAGGLLIESMGLPWYLSPDDYSVGRIVFWIYAVNEIFESGNSQVWAWEESTMTMNLKKNILYIEEVDSDSGFVCYPQRVFLLNEFVCQLTEQCKLVVEFGNRLLSLSGKNRRNSDFENNLKRNISEGIVESIQECVDMMKTWEQGTST